VVDDKAVAPVESVKTGILRVVTDIEGTNYRRKEMAGPVGFEPTAFASGASSQSLAPSETPTYAPSDLTAIVRHNISLIVERRSKSRPQNATRTTGSRLGGSTGSLVRSV